MVSMYSIAAGNYLLTYVTFILGFTALVVGYVVLNRAQLFKMVFFFAPLSVSIGIGGDSEIQLPTEPLIGLLTVLLFLYMFSLRSELKEIFSHPVSLLLLAEIGWMIACTFTSELKLVSLKYILIRVCYISVFFVLGTLLMRQEKKPWIFYILYAVGMIVPIINGMIFHAKLGFLQKTSYVMPQPFFNDHTVYGACIAFLIPAVMAMAFRSKTFIPHPVHRFLVLLLLALLLVAEYLSYSRAAWLSLGGAFGLYLLLKMKFSGRAFIISLLLLSTAAWFFQDTIYRSLSENNAISNKENLELQIKSITNINTDVSNKERLNRWKCAIRMGEERPVFGFGPRTYKFFYGNYQQRKDMTYTSTFNGTKGHAHSEYLQYWAETGIPGFCLHVFLYIVVMFKGINVFQRAREQKNRVFAGMAVLGFTTYFIHGVFNGFMDDEKMASLVFISMAVIVYLDLDEKRERAGQKTIADENGN